MFDAKLKDILQAFTELDVRPDTPQDEAKRQYRDLVQVWHPDRHNANQRLQLKAEDKLKRINAAWELVAEFYRAQEEIEKQEQELLRKQMETRERKKRELEEEKREQERKEREAASREQERRRRLEQEERERLAKEEQERQAAELLKREQRAREDLLQKEREEAERRAEEQRYVLHTCPVCKSSNRVPRDRKLKAAKCGNCKAPLANAPVKPGQKALHQSYRQRIPFSIPRRLPSNFVLVAGSVVLAFIFTLVSYRPTSEIRPITKDASPPQPLEPQYPPRPAPAVIADNRSKTTKSDMNAAKEFLDRGLYSKALPILRLYATNNDTLAQWQLGRLYFEGKGVRQNYVEAVRWFGLAADHGEIFSQRDLGIMYLYGIGVPKDYKLAEQWCRKAAEQGNAEAQYELATMYLDGKGVLTDHRQAEKWLRKAADKGHPKALATLVQRAHSPR